MLEATERGAGPSPVRRRSAAGLVVLALALVAGLVVVAATADGREFTRASTNDGGAWMVNRQFGVVGHKNRATGELSMHLRVTNSPAADVYQADGVVVVHDPLANELHEVDQRSFALDLQPTSLPEGTEVRAVPGGVIVTRRAPLAVWWIDAYELPTLSDLEGRVPLYAAEGSGVVTATSAERIAVVDNSARELVWLTATGTTGSPIKLSSSSTIDVTIVDSTAVVLGAEGDIAFVTDQVLSTVEWSELSNPPPQLRLLQQPADSGIGADAPPADLVTGINDHGDIIEVIGDPEQPIAYIRASLEGSDPLAPIVHRGCTHAVVQQPARAGVLCDALDTRELEGSGQDLRLRLVNGWVWINNVDDGGVWIAGDDLTLERIDDWGEVEEVVQPTPGPDGPTDAVSSDVTLVDDPDGEGGVQDADDQTEGPNVPPVAIDDLETRTRVNRTISLPVLDNDFDANNDILVVTSVNMTGGDGSVTITPTGQSVEVSPAPGFTGNIEATYDVSDGRSDPVSARISVAVVPADAANTPPTAATDVATTSPGSPTTVDLLANDIDPDGDPLALIDIATDSGTIVWDPTGQITFTPDTTTQAGWVEMGYTIADDLGATSSGRLRVEIRDRGTNQEPDARNDHASTVVGRPVALQLLANDTDPDGDALIIGKRPQLIAPEGATPQTSTTADGEFVFSTDQPGTYLFLYGVSDGSENDTARIRIDVSPARANTPPVAVRDDIVIARGSRGVAQVLDNDGDVDGDVVAIVDWQAADGLVIAKHTDASGHIGFVITVLADAPPRPSFTYSISDGLSEPVSASVVVAVTEAAPQNQAPIAVDDRVEVRAGRIIEGIGVLANDYDPEGGPLRIVAVGDPDDGTATVAPDGQSITLAVDEDATASFSLSYDIEDDAGNRAAATVRVQLIPATAPNRPPYARTDLGRTTSGNAIEIRVVDNDYDPDNDAIVLEGITSQPGNGVSRVVAPGVIEYQPDPEFSGTDVLTYSIVDAAGDSATGEVFIGVVGAAGTNLAPIANDDSYELGPTIAATRLDVLSNDFDPESDPLRIISVGDPDSGQVTLDELGQLQYTPAPSRPAAVTDVFSYSISDSRGNTARATVTVTLEITPEFVPTPTPEPTAVVTRPTPTPDAGPTPDPAIAEPTPTPSPTPEAQNLAPIAVADEVGPVKAGSEVLVAVLANDFDPDGEQSELRVASADGGSVVGNEVSVTAGGSTTQVSYTIEDAGGAQASALITVLVTENQAPIADPLTLSTGFETPLPVDVSSQVSDPDGDVVLFICCDSIRGGALSDVAEGPNTLSLTFTPNASFSGVAGFAYTVDDQNGNQTSGTVTVEVEAPQNQAPSALDNNVEVPQGESTTVNLAALTSDPDGDELTWSLTSGLDGEVSSALNGSSLQISANRTAAVGPTGSATYEVSDGTLTASGQITVSVIAGANEAPVTTDSSVSIAARSSATIDLSTLTNDPDVNDPTTWTINTELAGEIDASVVGSILQLSAPASAAGSEASIGYTATDSRGEASTSSITVEVTDPDVPPPAVVDDEASTEPGIGIDISPLGNDVDPLGEGLSVLTVAATDGTATVRPDGKTIRYVPGDFVGTTNLAYTIADNAGREATGTITVETVAPPDQPAPPEVTADSGEVTISWSTPQANGSTITGYIITLSTGETREVGLQNSFVWDGLDNGSTYTFTVTAVSDKGNSQPSTPSLEATPDVVPETPAPPTVEFRNRALFVTWTAPVNNGSEITRYELEIGGATSGTTSLGTETEFEWRGLTNGEEYTFRVRAENGAGFGPFSAQSASEHPETAPAAPIIGVTERAGLSAALVVNWTTPTNTGGGDIIEYRIVSSDGSSRLVTGANIDSYEWSELETGVELQFQVQARNRAGWGPLSNLSAATVACGIPDAPSFASVIRGDGEVPIVVGEPDDNGCAITSYVITSTATSSGETQVQNSANVNHTFDGLSNGTEYTFVVRAINEIGTGPPSGSSTPVIPAGPPICAASATMSAQASAPGTIDLSWTAAISNGSAITDYEVDAGSGFASVGGPGESQTRTGLANGTSYSFDVRAVNDVGVSPPCAGASALTWDVPAAVVPNLTYDAALEQITATVSGGTSLDTPITSWTATFTNTTTGVTAQVITGPPPGSLSFTHQVLEDGAYQFDFTICNVVGCTDAPPECCLDITLNGPPEQMGVPTLRHVHTPWDRFGLEMLLDFEEPNDNGAPITEYVYEFRWIGSSGEWHDEADTVTATSEPIFFWPGYTAWTNGIPFNMEARVAAVNAEGQGDWSEWTFATPPLRDAHLTLVPGALVPCGNGEGDGPMCREIWYSALGVPAWTTNTLTIEAAGDLWGGQGQSADLCPGFTFETREGGVSDGLMPCAFGWWGHELRGSVSSLYSGWVVWNE